MFKTWEAINEKPVWARPILILLILLLMPFIILHGVVTGTLLKDIAQDLKIIKKENTNDH